MKKPPVEELSRIRKFLANPQHYSAHQLRVWRKQATKLKRSVEAAFKRQREKNQDQHQLILKLK